jgi:RNA polymerase sigma-70 factor (ECF subfamily)
MRQFAGILKIEMNPELNSLSDDDLVVRAQARDESAFEELMRRNSSSSLRLALSMLRDRQEAEDEVQNSFLSAWQHLGQFQRGSKFSTWMTRILLNQCLMRLRKVRRATFVFLDEPVHDDGPARLELRDKSASPEAELQNEQLSVILEREIRRLPPLLRSVLVLRDVNERSTYEVAEELGISPAAVKSRLSRARSELRRRISSVGYAT